MSAQNSNTKISIAKDYSSDTSSFKDNSHSCSSELLGKRQHSNSSTENKYQDLMMLKDEDSNNEDGIESDEKKERRYFHFMA
jgi:hypothetical protein